MRPDHTAPDVITPQSPLAAPLERAADTVSRKGMRLIARVTFCFAWLFGLEPFLAGQADEVADAGQN